MPRIRSVGVAGHVLAQLDCLAVTWAGPRSGSSIRTADGRPEREEIACQTQDVGSDGALLEAAIDLRPDRIISFSVTLPEDPDPVRARARVSEVTDGLASLEFLTLERDTRRRLSGFVTEHLRRRLSIVRSLQQEEDDDWN